MKRMNHFCSFFIQPLCVGEAGLTGLSTVPDYCCRCIPDVHVAGLSMNRNIAGGQP